MGTGRTGSVSEKLNRLRVAGQNPLLAENAPSAVQTFCEAVYAVVKETLWARAYSASFQILRTSQDQEDAIQDALIRIFAITLRLCRSERIRWTEPDTVLGGYFKEIARKALTKERDKIGKRLRRMRMRTLEQDPEALYGDDLTGYTDLRYAVETMVEDEVDRIVILLRSEEIPFEEISLRLKAAKRCEITAAALRKRFERARGELQAKLSDLYT